ncbi:UNVERIFIED_CONTAM: hypothetical protein Sindi_0721400 [Sesamum indicum]
MNGRPTTQELYRLMMPPGPKVDWTSLLSGPLKIPRHMFILWLAILEKLATTDKPWLSHLGIAYFAMMTMWRNRNGHKILYGGHENGVGNISSTFAYRALLGSCVYLIWKERNTRRFEQVENPPSMVANLIMEDMRQRIISLELPSSVSTRALYRLWRIPWPVEGDT